MKIFIYKRTHKHDPDENGVFGNQDCMGRLRNGDYDAVIGIGGLSPWPDHIDIMGKINWVGLERKKNPAPKKRGDEIVFSHFKLYEEKGKDIQQNYPNFYKYIYGSRCRFVKKSDFPAEVQKELDQIINSIKKCPPSKMYDSTNTKKIKDNCSSTKCKEICPRKKRKKNTAPGCKKISVK